jgi:hypothetical protein
MKASPCRRQLTGAGTGTEELYIQEEGLVQYKKKVSCRGGPAAGRTGYGVGIQDASGFFVCKALV